MGKFEVGTVIFGVTVIILVSYYTSIANRESKQNDIIKTTNLKNLILSDSMTKLMKPISRVDIIPYPGRNITTLRKDVMRDIPKSQFEEYQCIIILVGTNDIGSNLSEWITYKEKLALHLKNVTEYLVPVSKLFDVGMNFTSKNVTKKYIYNDFRKLVTYVKSQTQPETVIFLSSILPRPYDFKFRKEHVKVINTAIKELAVDKGLKFVDPYPMFVERKRPKYDLFEDGLHLNTEGLEILREFYEKTLLVPQCLRV